MHFHKFPYLANFEFARMERPPSLQTSKGAYALRVETGAGDIYRFKISGPGWKTRASQVELSFQPEKSPALDTRLLWTEGGGFRLEDANGSALLVSLPSRFFGQCGTASVFEFVREEGDLFYGLGEKWSGLEHSGKTTKFWNTDVWADFHRESVRAGVPSPDPVYVSIPYLIIQRRGVFIGLLLDNSEETFISTGFTGSIFSQMDLELVSEPFAEAVMEGDRFVDSPDAQKSFIHLGAESGAPGLFVLVGPSLAALTRKFQMLVGSTPRPPAWALGYHQCRWGYESEKDLQELDRNFRASGIPVDGLWLDIDYMRGYRVFTFEPRHFPQVEEALANWQLAGRKVVPIIDPGVKLERKYSVYESGRAAGVFCQNRQGQPFVGLVWPGETVFPDFSLPAVRAWWAELVGKFAALGIEGAWLDMNDPSTGPVDNSEMLFQDGAHCHATYHNQYALGMAQATHAGFLQARPNRRPFLLTRSGCTGSARYTAIWTGDNVSNYHHLKNSIATTLNLALSGVPFNAADVGGFGGDATPELICDWYKAAFLFPVFRNHAMKGTRQQEPWAFGPAVLKTLRHYVQLRYRLRLYLYQLFIEQEATGEAILRPLFYDFTATRRLPLGKIDDQFLVGPWIMQAPFVEEKQASRSITLPGGTRWYDLSQSQWLSGGRKIKVGAHKTSTPIFIRDGAILPLARVKPAENAFNGERVDFHVFLSGDGNAETRYVFDDGTSFAYREGACSEVIVRARRQQSEMAISIEVLQDRRGTGEFTFSTDPSINAVTINGHPAQKVSPQGIAFVGRGWNTWALVA